MNSISGRYYFSGGQRPEVANSFPNPNVSNSFIQFWGDEKLNIKNSPKLTIIFTGELFNTTDLIDKLGLDSKEHLDDLSLVLKTYKSYGVKCVHHLQGHFTFAIWDHEMESMMVARDPFGAIPLFYFYNTKELVFSTSFQTILSLLPEEKILRKASVIDYLRFQTVHAPYTLVENVYTLLPGQYLLFSDEKQSLKTYWNPTTHYEFSGNSMSEAKSTLKNKLELAFQNIKSTKQEAIWLKGTKNDAVLAHLQSQNNSNPNTFSVNHSHFTANSDNINLISTQNNTTHQSVELNQNDYLKWIKQAVESADVPTGATADYFVLSQLAKTLGFQTLITDDTMTEWFAEYDIYNELPEVQEKKWLSSFPNYARKLVGIFEHQFKGEVETLKQKELLKQEYFDAEYIYQFYRQILMDEQVRKLVKMADLPLNRAFEIGHEYIGYDTAGWGLPPLSRISVAEFFTYFQNHQLLSQYQQSQTQSVNLKHPMMNTYLVSFLLGLMDKIKKNETVQAFHWVTYSDQLADLNETNIPAWPLSDYTDFLKSDLKDWAKTQLDEVKQIPYIQSKSLDKLWTDFQNNHKLVDWRRVWHLVTLGAWLKKSDVRF